MESEGDEIKSKQASKRDRTLKMFTIIFQQGQQSQQSHRHIHSFLKAFSGGTAIGVKAFS